jgi:hypothetical protein
MPGQGKVTSPQFCTRVAIGELKVIHSATDPAARLGKGEGQGPEQAPREELLEGREAEKEEGKSPCLGGCKWPRNEEIGKMRVEMQALKAHVRGGRIVLDEPTDLPEGEVIELVPLDEVLANGGDYLDEEERERLHASLREGIRQMKAGQTIDAAVALAELRDHR